MADSNCTTVICSEAKLATKITKVKVASLPPIVFAKWRAYTDSSKLLVSLAPLLLLFFFLRCFGTQHSTNSVLLTSWLVNKPCRELAKEYQ